MAVSVGCKLQLMFNSLLWFWLLTTLPTLVNAAILTVDNTAIEQSTDTQSIDTDAQQLQPSTSQQQQQINPIAQPAGNDLLAPSVDDDVYIASLVNSHNYNGYNQNSNNNNNNNHNKKKHNFGNALDDTEHHLEDEEGESSYPPPVFDFGMPRNITARTGHTAAINCRVDNLGDKSVSWIRKRDLHILTAGILTYTSDERFKVVRTADSKDWTLHVKYAQPRDSGIYECQVNTEPKISMAFRLNVIVTPPDAKAIIAGPADLYVKVGSIITLTCHVKQPTTAAQDIGPIYWYRGPYILTPFVAHPNDAAIDLQRISMESTLAEKLQSRLRIANAQLLDTGNYTCMPTTAEAASVIVNVINDESPAAMQKSNGSASAHQPALSSYSLLILLVLAATISSNTVVRWLLQGDCNPSVEFHHFKHINYCSRQCQKYQNKSYQLTGCCNNLSISTTTATATTSATLRTTTTDAS